MAARQLRDVPVRTLGLLAAAGLVAASAQAEHPGRTLESRRASAPVVYLATVTAVEDLGADEMGAPPITMMRATLLVDRMLRSDLPPPPPINVVVRYRQAAKQQDEGLPGQLFYRLAAGDRVVVFAPSYEPSYPIEMIAGPAKTVATQVQALRAYLGEMDEMTQRLHGVTPDVKAKQTALYDRILVELRSPSPR